MSLCITVLTAIVFAAIIYYCMFYPQQSMPLGIECLVHTPQPERYHNDCLHPCIRYVERGKWKGKYIMVQSPLYGGDESIENPILYISDDCEHWSNGVVVHDTPLSGYNSDPALLVEDDRIFVFWREFDTPACEKNGTNIAIFGCHTDDGISFSEPILYLSNTYPNGSNGFPRADIAQCPIIMKRGDDYLIYGVVEDYENYTCQGISIWLGHSLLSPDFKLMGIWPMKPVITVGKWIQKRVFGRLFYIPRPSRRMLWHFDLFEYQNTLYLVFGVGKGKDSILLARADDWTHFRTYHKPLINNLASECILGWRQYYYKSTAFVKEDEIHLFYTINNPLDHKQNMLWHSVCPVNKVI